MENAIAQVVTEMTLRVLYTLVAMCGVGWASAALMNAVGDRQALETQNVNGSSKLLARMEVRSKFTAVVVLAMVVCSGIAPSVFLHVADPDTPLTMIRALFLLILSTAVVVRTIHDSNVRSVILARELKDARRMAQMMDPYPHEPLTPTQGEPKP